VTLLFNFSLDGVVSVMGIKVVDFVDFSLVTVLCCGLLVTFVVCGCDLLRIFVVVDGLKLVGEGGLLTKDNTGS